MVKSERIRLIYSIFLAIFTVVVGVAFICVAADIYFSGKGTGVIYTQEIVSGKLKAFIAPMVLLIVAIVVGGILFPLYDVRAKSDKSDVLKRLKSRMPSGGEGEEYETAKKAYEKESKICLIVWICALAVTLAAVIASLCYICDMRNFPNEDTTKEMLALAKNVLPWVLVALISVSVASVYSGIATERRIKQLKTLIKYGNGEVAEKNEPALVARAKEIYAQFSKEVAANRITLWIVRGIVFVIAISFIIAGAVNGGARDVLVKAINICQECIGLG